MSIWWPALPPVKVLRLLGPGSVWLAAAVGITATSYSDPSAIPVTVLLYIYIDVAIPIIIPPVQTFLLNSDLPLLSSLNSYTRLLNRLLKLSISKTKITIFPLMCLL